MKICWLLLLFSLLFLPDAQSQEGYKLHIQIDESRIHLNDSSQDKTYRDSLLVIQELHRLLNSVRSEGYFFAETDTLLWKGKLLYAYIRSGPRFFIAGLKNGNIEPRILNAAGYAALPKNTPFSLNELELLFKKLLEVYQNQGYPFASIKLDSIAIRDSLITAGIYADPGRFITLDPIAIAGNALVSSKFLQTYLELKPGTPYNEKLILSADERLQQLSFLKVVKPSEVRFINDKATVTFFLNKKNASRFDGILGLVPGGRSEKIQLTGDITLKLQNAFRYAEQLGFNFKSFSEQGRQLDFHFSVPSVFSSPIGIGTELNLYKQDTSFQNVSARAEAVYNASTSQKIGLYVERHNGNIFRDSTFVNNSYAAVKTTLYGLRYRYSRLDNTLVPLNGLVITVDGNAGLKNAKLPAVQDQLKSSQYQIKTLFDFYYSGGRRSVFRLENQSALLAGKRLYENELYRIGGFDLLRGFDEKSIAASAYSVFNVEYRYLIERYSFIFIFCNQGFVQRQTIMGRTFAAPLGFGSGINLETKAGILSFSYALGKQKNIPVNLQQGKIHFGLSALF